MYVGREYSVTYPPTTLLDGFDFINDLADGDGVAEATAALTVHTGVDNSPGSHLLGFPIVLSGTVVVQNIGELLAGVTYILQIVISTNQGDTISLYSRIACLQVY